MKWLVTSFDSRPNRRGGIATFSFELTKALAALPSEQVELLAPSCISDKEFDQKNSFSTKRIALPHGSVRAIFPLSRQLKSMSETNSFDHVLNFLWLPDAVSSFFSGSTNYSIIVHGVEILEVQSTFKKRLRKLFSPIKRSVFKKAQRVFVVSHFTAEWVKKECGVSAEKIFLLHPGVDLKQWPLIKRIEKPVQRFFTVTRLFDYKGIDKVLEAMALLKKNKQTQWQYYIAGVGEDRSRLEKMVLKLDLVDHVKFLGGIDDTTLQKYYSEADVFILCSREDWVTPNVEGFGIVFLEAAACSIPSIAGNSGGIGDAVIDGETGWLVQPDDENAIYKILNETINNPQEVRRRGDAARARVEREFQWEHVAKRLVTVCNHVRN